MSSSTDDSSTARDPLDEQVFQFLDERDQGLVSSYEDFLVRHPSSDPGLRQRIEALEHAGLLGDDSAAPFPEQLGNFRLLERLGAGGMGIVFRAEEITLQRIVALKLVRPELIYQARVKERFRREVEAIAKLSHPGIVQVYSLSEDQGIPFFTMELVDGASLGDVLTRFAGSSAASLSGADLKQAVEAISGRACTSSPLFEGSWPRACVEIARQVALALEHAHQLGVVHRDVKPSNIILTPDGRARLLDFGLASLSGAARLTQSGAQLGSLPYMPPELVQGRKHDAVPSTDIYSLGVTLYECLGLSLPYGADTVTELALRICAGKLPSLRRSNPDVSVDAETICSVALDLDPRRRYSTAGAFALDLVNVLERRPIAVRRSSHLLRAQRFAQRNPSGTAAAVFATLIVVGGPIGYGVLQRNAANLERGLNEQLRASNQVVREKSAALEKRGEDLTAALEREREAGARAERNFAHALTAVDEMLATVGAEDLREVPRLGPVRMQLLERARAFYDLLEQEDPGDPRVRRELARTAGSIGDLQEDLGRSDESLADYLTSVELARAAFESDPDSDETEQILASSLNRLARKYDHAGDVELARAGYTESLMHYERLVAAIPDDPALLHDLAVAHFNVAMIGFTLGESEAALERFLQSVEVVRPACALWPDDENLIGILTMSLAMVSTSQRNLGQVDEARRNRAESWRLMHEFCLAHPDSRKVRTDFLEVSTNHGLDLIGYDPAEAERVLLLGLETGRQLTSEFPEDPFVRRGFVGVAVNLGIQWSNELRWEEADQVLLEAVEQCEFLLGIDSERIEFRYMLASSLGCRSTSSLNLGRADDAGEFAARGVAIFDGLLSEMPDHPFLRAGAAAALMQRADVESRTGDWRTASASMDAALALEDERNDIAFQAFETLLHVRDAALADAGLEDEQRATTLEGLLQRALDQLEHALEWGFEDRARAESRAAGNADLLENPRFQALLLRFP